MMQDSELLKKYEPVLRFTKSERFFPMAVEPYLERCYLLPSGPQGAVEMFFHGFANHALVTLHVDNLRGHNAHHQCETVFKAFARALRMAVEPDPRTVGAVPSTKGML